MDCVSLTRRIVRRKSLFNQDNSVFSPVEDNDRRQGKTGLDWLLNLSPRLQRFATLATPYFQTADTHTQPPNYRRLNLAWRRVYPSHFGFEI
jgi:hypothetical protein